MDSWSCGTSCTLEYTEDKVEKRHHVFQFFKIIALSYPFCTRIVSLVVICQDHRQGLLPSLAMVARRTSCPYVVGISGFCDPNVC